METRVDVGRGLQFKYVMCKMMNLEQVFEVYFIGFSFGVSQMSDHGVRYRSDSRWLKVELN